ncbi:MAG: phosphoglycerate dehydrogenase [Elusimicrobia bacterium]|nr:phosphoglycerate dehydrogenase [Elusimicrobiota bacterium]
MTDNGKRFTVLVTDPIDREGLKPLSDHPGLDVRVELNPAADKLQSLLADTNAWLVRSETKVTAQWLEKAPALRIIGRTGVGVDNIDVAGASRRGIAVINAPQANTIAACEHTWGLILALSRNIPQADSDMKQGKWDRTRWMGTELQGKTLGVVGLGRIGREVAKRGLAFGMRVVVHDPYISVEQARGLGVSLLPLPELLGESDIISLHVPGGDQTKGLINDETMHQVKKGARIINCARGELVQEKALVDAIKSGHLGGAALDVFTKEPLAADSPLRGLPNVILTPHLGASTTEAQRKVAEELSKGILEFVERGLARYALNLPGFDPETLEQIGPYLELGEKLGAFVGQMLDSGLKEIRTVFRGDFEERHRHPVSVAALKGVLTSILAQGVGFINAPILARERGIKTSDSIDPAILEGYNRLLDVVAVTDQGEVRVTGAILSHAPRIVRLGDLVVDVRPKGKMIVLENQDQPGMIGHVGTLLGKRGVNISDMRVGRHAPQQKAVMVLTIDEDVSPDVLKELGQIPGITGVRWVRL